MDNHWLYLARTAFFQTNFFLPLDSLNIVLKKLYVLSHVSCNIFVWTVQMPSKAERIAP